MKSINEDEMKGKIIERLIRYGIIGANVYKNIRIVKSLFRKHLVGKAYRLVEEMIKDGILISHKGGDCISVNLSSADLKAEVDRLIEIFLKTKFKG